MATADEYEELKEIGRGSYGTVWLIKHKINSRKFVLKKIDLKRSSEKERQSAVQEAKLLSQLHHPNIVSYRDSYTRGNLLHIMMSFCEGGDLYNYLLQEYKTKSVIVEERQILQWFIQIAMALQYLHERNILHRDLKTQNIFLTNHRQVIKVGDLGIAKVLGSSEDMAKTFTGTPYYMSPELFAHQPYNHKSDVWAFGICTYEMVTLDHAFSARDMNTLAMKVLRGKMPPMPTEYSANLVNLIRAMLHREPSKRPTIRRILQEPFIRRNIENFLNAAKQSAANAAPQSAPARTPPPPPRPAPSPSPVVSPTPPSVKSEKKEVKQLVNVQVVVAAKAVPNAVAVAKAQAAVESSADSRSRSNGQAQAQAVIKVQEPRVIKSDFSQPDPKNVPKPVLLVARSDKPVIAGPCAALLNQEPRKERLLELDRKSNDSCNKVASSTELKNVAIVDREAPSSARKQTPQALRPPESRLVASDTSENKQRNEAARARRRQGREQGDANGGSNGSVELSRQRGNSELVKAGNGNRAVNDRPTCDVTDNGNHMPRKQNASASPAIVPVKKSSEASSVLPVASRPDQSRPKENGHVLVDQDRRVGDVSQEQARPGNVQSASAPKLTVDAANVARKVSPGAQNRKLFQQLAVSSSSSDSSEEEEVVKPNNANKNTDANAVKKESSSKIAGADLWSMLRRERKAHRNVKHLINALECTVRNLADNDDISPNKPLKALNTPKQSQDESAAPEKRQQVVQLSVESSSQRNDSSKKTDADDNDDDNMVGPVAEETIGQTEVMTQQFIKLRKELIQAIGYEKLKVSYEILDRVELEETEPKLIALLGQAAYDEYIGKIHTVKFYEEIIFKQR